MKWKERYKLVKKREEEVKRKEDTLRRREEELKRREELLEKNLRAFEQQKLPDYTCLKQQKDWRVEEDKENIAVFQNFKLV
jgi:hypothetical protein